jgi:hypothetical protein
MVIKLTELSSPVAHQANIFPFVYLSYINIFLPIHIAGFTALALINLGHQGQNMYVNLATR